MKLLTKLKAIYNRKYPPFKPLLHEGQRIRLLSPCRAKIGAIPNNGTYSLQIGEEVVILEYCILIRTIETKDKIHFRVKNAFVSVGMEVADGDYVYFEKRIFETLKYKTFT